MRITIYVLLSLLLINNLSSAEQQRTTGFVKFKYASDGIFLMPSGLYAGGRNAYSYNFPYLVPSTNNEWYNADYLLKYKYRNFDESYPNSIYCSDDALFVLSKRRNRIEICYIQETNGQSNLKQSVLISGDNCSKPSDMILVGNKMFWTNSGTNSIGFATIEYSSTTDRYEVTFIDDEYITNCKHPVGITYDSKTNTLYWTNFLGGELGFGTIGRVSIDDLGVFGQEAVEQEYITNCFGPVDIKFINFENNTKSMLVWTNWLDYKIGALTEESSETGEDINDKVVLFDFGGSPYKLELMTTTTESAQNVSNNRMEIPGNTITTVKTSNLAWINMHQSTVGTCPINDIYEILVTQELNYDNEMSLYEKGGRRKFLDPDLAYIAPFTESKTELSDDLNLFDIPRASYSLIDFVLFDHAFDVEFVGDLTSGTSLPLSVKNERTTLIENTLTQFYIYLPEVESNYQNSNFKLCADPSPTSLSINGYQQYSDDRVISCNLQSSNSCKLYIGHDEDGDNFSIPIPAQDFTIQPTNLCLGAVNKGSSLELSVNLPSGEDFDISRLKISPADMEVLKPSLQVVKDGIVKITKQQENLNMTNSTYTAQYISLSGDTLDIELPFEDTPIQREMSNIFFCSLQESTSPSIARLSPVDSIYSKNYYKVALPPESVETDEKEKRVLWTNGVFSISRMNYDRSEYVPHFLKTLDSIKCFALDTKNEYIYVGHNGRISRWDLDAKNPIDDFIVNCGDVRDVEIDTTGAGAIYWINGTTSKICKADLDGSNINTSLISVTGGAQGLAINLSDSKIYWTKYSNLTVGRANLDGTSAQSSYIYGTTGHSGDIEKSKLENKLYYKRDEYLAEIIPNGTSTPTVNTSYSLISNSHGLATGSDFNTIDKVEVKVFDFQIENGTLFKTSDTINISFKVENSNYVTILRTNVNWDITDGVVPSYVSLTGSGTSTDPYIFKYRLIVSSALTEGAYAVRMWIEDNNGSRSNTINTGDKGFFIDNTSPQILNMHLSEYSYEQYETIKLILVTSDGEGGFIDPNGITIVTTPYIGKEFELISEYGNTYIYQLTTDETTSLNNYDITINMTDATGNTSVYDPSGTEFEVVINNTADFDNVVVDSPFVSKGGELLVGFDLMYNGDGNVDENSIIIETSPSLQNQFTLVDRIGEGTHTDPERLVFSVPISSNEAEGKYQIIISGTDDMGHEAEMYSSSRFEFYIDETNPNLSNIQSDATTYTTGDMITLSFNTSDTGSYDLDFSDISIKANKSLRNKISLYEHNSDYYVYRVPVEALDPKGDLTFTIKITDRAGNITTGTKTVTIN